MAIFVKRNNSVSLLRIVNEKNSKVISELDEFRIFAHFIAERFL